MCRLPRSFKSARLILIAFTLAFLSMGCAEAGSSEKVTANPLESNNEVSSNDAHVTPIVPAGCEEFQKLVDETYDFKPSKLTPVQRTATSAEMDIVWEKVKADKKLQPCLVAALESPKANSFFRFDGSTLLYSLDKSDATKKLLIKSYARTDLEDVMDENWIAYLLQLGFDGYDTSEAGGTWLLAKDPGYYLPQHGTLKVDKYVGALAIFGSMDEKYATPALAQIASQRDHAGREIAVSLLRSQVTPEAFDALSKLDQAGLTEQSRLQIKRVLDNPTFIQKREGEPKISRTEYVKAFRELAEGRPDLFMDLASRVPDGERDAVAVLLPEDIPLVRKSRRFFASTGTPHAPEWYQSFTDILMVMVRNP